MEKVENKLVRGNWISPNQLIKIKEEHQKSNKSLLAIVVKMGYMTEQDVYMFFAREAQIPYVSVSDYHIEKRLFALFSEQFCREHLCVPLFQIENTLYVSMATPLDTDLISTLEIKSAMDINPMFSSPSAILKALNDHFGPDDRFFAPEDFITAPQILNMIPFWRESERVEIKVPIEFKSVDQRVVLVSSAYIDATATDISKSGRAMGFKSLAFLPPETKLKIKFPSYDPSYEADVEVVRCKMEKDGKYLIGAKFLSIKEDLIKNILVQTED